MALSQIFKFFFFFTLPVLLGKGKLDTGLSFACQYTSVAGFPLKALETLSLTLSRGMKRAASPRAEQPPHSKKVVDAKGFRVRQQNIDKHKITSESTATQKSIHEEETEGANYVIEGRLRRVTPYFYTYLTYCKLRWQDRKLIDVFIDEFRDRTPDAYRKAVEEGLVKVNSQVANLETILRNGDLISHRSYRRTTCQLQRYKNCF